MVVQKEKEEEKRKNRNVERNAVQPNAMSVAEVTDKLGLHSLRNRKWYIQATCATSGEGLFEGLDWLSANIAA